MRKVLSKVLIVGTLAVAFLVAMAGMAFAQDGSGGVFDALTAAFAGLLVFVAAPAAGVTKLVDAVRYFDKDDTWPKVIWIVLAMVFGVGIALLFLLNGIAPVIQALPRFQDEVLSDTAGQVLTGIAIGGVASGFHELFDLWSSTAKSRRPV